VDQDALGKEFRQRLQTIANGKLPCISPIGDREQTPGKLRGKRGNRSVVKALIVRVDHDERLLDHWAAEEHVQCADQDRFPAQEAVLLGYSLTGSRSTSCSNDEGSD